MPKISVIIPARNEERHIGGCLAAIEAAAGRINASVEIIVVLNRCSDHTEALAREHACVIVSDDRKNLAQIRNSGARAASGDWLVTIDADSRMSANMLERVSAELSSARVVGGGVLILPERWSAGIILTGICLVPVALWHGISGGLFFCRKADFDAIGGFNEHLTSVEDIDFAIRLKRHGRQKGQRFVTLLRSWIVTSCRKFDYFGDWYFLRHPLTSLQLLKSRNPEAASRIWYDFEHR